MKLVIATSDYAYAAYLKLTSYLMKQARYEVSNKMTGQLVLLIPGVYENWYFFRHLQKSLVSAGYTVINTEELFGSKSVLDDGNKIAKYLETHNIESAFLVGHSSGGLVAVRALQLSGRIAKVITIAAPFHGVTNGRLLRTKSVKDLLPDSRVFVELGKLTAEKKRKVVSIYPSYDNQIWSKKGSVLAGAKNVTLRGRGHHLVLRSKELASVVISEL